MEWDKNTKIIVAVVVVVIVIAAAVGIGMSVNNNNNSTEITYQGNGGKTSDGKESYVSNSDKVVENSFGKSGYSFTGWKEGDKEWKVGDSISGKHTLVAQWKFVNSQLHVASYVWCDPIPQLYVKNSSGELELIKKFDPYDPISQDITLPSDGKTVITMQNDQTGWTWDSNKECFTMTGEDGVVYTVKVTVDGSKSLTPKTGLGYVQYEFTYDPGKTMNLYIEEKQQKP